MELKKLYTAVGRLEREANGCGHSCPVIVLGGERYMVDMQEMVVWTALNWRISKWDDISCQCVTGWPPPWADVLPVPGMPASTVCSSAAFWYPDAAKQNSMHCTTCSALLGSSPPMAPHLYAACPLPSWYSAGG